MATFTGTFLPETIRPGDVSFTVTTMGGASPSNAVDTIDAGGGDDVVEGAGGDDNVNLGGGDDRFIWNLGDDDDEINGAGGYDTVDFFGSGGDQDWLLGAIGGGPHVGMYEGLGDTDPVDLNNVERIRMDMGAGEDSAILGDFAGTDVEKVQVELSGPGNSPDGDEDNLAILCGDGNDRIDLVKTGDAITVLGMAAEMKFDAYDAGLDTLLIKGYGGNDRIDASALPVNSMVLTLEGGNGDDKLTGSDRRDILSGDQDEDLLKAGKGDDFLAGGADNDKLAGGKGADDFAFFTDLAAAGVDKILDFKVGTDTILLDSGVFSGIGMSFTVGEFAIGASAGDATDRIIYNDVTGRLYYDEDGTGVGFDQVAFAKLDAGLALTISDFEYLIV